MRVSHLFGRGQQGPRFAAAGASRHEPEDAHPHSQARRHRASDNSSRLAFGLLVALGAVLVVVLGLVATQSRLDSFEELQNKISTVSGGRRVFPVTPYNDFVAKLGVPTSEREDPGYLYLYYSVREGTVEIALDRGGWTVNEARVRRVSLLGQR